MSLVDFALLRLQISTLQSQIHCQETDLQSQEEELSRAKADLGRLQQEENQLEQSLTAGKIQLETIIKSLKATQDEINQVANLCEKCQQGASLHCIIQYLGPVYHKRSFIYPQFICNVLLLPPYKGHREVSNLDF